MQDVQEVSSLIGDIYDAALDPALWIGVLLKARALVGGSCATLFSKDATRKSLNVYYDDGGLDPHYKQLYFDKYAKLDPTTTGHVFAEIGEPISTADLLPYDEFARNPHIQGVGAPAGPGGFRLRRARQIGDERRHVRCLPARARRFRRR